MIELLIALVFCYLLNSTAMNYYTAIVFFPPAMPGSELPGSGRPPAKYRNINRPQNFEVWAKRQGAWYVNYYDKKSKAFSHRTWLMQFREN